MDLREWNLKQIKESQSELNRYYFGLNYPDTKPTKSMLLIFYIQHGGAYEFEKKNKQEKP